MGRVKLLLPRDGVSQRIDHPEAFACGWAAEGVNRWFAWIFGYDIILNSLKGGMILPYGRHRHCGRH